MTEKIKTEETLSDIDNEASKEIDNASKEEIKELINEIDNVDINNIRNIEDFDEKEFMNQLQQTVNATIKHNGSIKLRDIIEMHISFLVSISKKDASKMVNKISVDMIQGYLKAMNKHYPDSLVKKHLKKIKHKFK